MKQSTVKQPVPAAPHTNRFSAAVSRRLSGIPWLAAVTAYLRLLQQQRRDWPWLLPLLLLVALRSYRRERRRLLQRRSA